MESGGMRSEVVHMNGSKRLMPMGRPFFSGRDGESAEPPPGTHDTYSHVGANHLSGRFWAATVNGLAAMFGGPTVSFRNFSVMESLAGTRFYFKHAGNRLIVAGGLSDACEFVHSLHDTVWSLVCDTYMSLAATRRMIEETPIGLRGPDIKCFKTRGMSQERCIKVSVRRRRKNGFVELCLESPVRGKPDWMGMLQGFSSKREREIEMVVQEASQESVLSSLGKAMSVLDTDGHNNLLSMLPRDVRLSKERLFSGPFRIEVEVGARSDTRGKITAIVLRFIQGVGSREHPGQVENVVEFVGSLDGDSRRIIWVSRNQATVEPRTNEGFLRAGQLMRPVRDILSPVCESKFVCPRDEYPVEECGGLDISDMPAEVTVAAAPPRVGAQA